MSDEAAMTAGDWHAGLAKGSGWGTFLWHLDDARLAELRSPGVGGARIGATRDAGVESMRLAFDALFGSLGAHPEVERAVVAEPVGVVLVLLSLGEPSGSLARKVIEAAATWVHARRVTWSDLRRGGPGPATARMPGPRMATGVPAFDRCLGGGPVHGSVALVLGTGPVGVLLAQLAARAAALGLHVLHVRSEPLMWAREAPDPHTFVLSTTDIDAVVGEAALCGADLIVVDDLHTMRTRMQPGDAEDSTAAAFDRLHALSCVVGSTGERPAVVAGCDPDAAHRSRVAFAADAVLKFEDLALDTVRIDVGMNRYGSASESALLVNVRGTLVEPGEVSPTLHGFTRRAIALLHFVYAVKEGALADGFRRAPSPEVWEGPGQTVWAVESRRIHLKRGAADPLVGARGWNALAAEIDAAGDGSPKADALRIALAAVGVHHGPDDVLLAIGMMNAYGLGGSCR